MGSKRPWIVTIGVLSAVLAVLLAACGDGNGKVKVRIGEVARSIFYAPQYAAITLGYFEEEGLEVELTTTPGGDKAMTALLSGSVDIALVGAETSIYVYQQGAEDRVINFAQLTQTDGTFLVSRKPVDSFSWSDLKGVTFLGQRKGGMPQMAGEYAMRKNGLDPHADMTMLQNVDFANIAPAFASGTGDFVQLFEPQATIFERDGTGHVVASFGVESGRLPYTVFMSKESYMSANEETIRKFTRAIHKAQKWVHEADVREVAEALAPFFPDTEPEVIEGAVARYRDQGTYADDPMIDEEEWNHLLDIMEEAGELLTRAPHAELVDNRYAEQAMDEAENP